MLRFTFLLLSLLLFIAWWLNRRPVSPTDSLPAVAYAAFSVDIPTSRAGQSLAQAARQWPGVTASTFNEISGLIVLIHTTDTDAGALRNRLEELAAGPVLPKQFAPAKGPQCPVPHDMLKWIASLYLGGAVLFAALFVFFTRMTYRRPTAV